MSPRIARALALSGVALTGLLALSGLILSLVFPNPEVTHRLWLPFSFLQPVACAVIGGLIVVRQPRNTVGWLLLLIGLDAGALILTEVYEPIVSANPGAPLGLELRRTISDLTWVASIPLVCLILQLFPRGRPLSPKWRFVAWLTGLWMLFGVAVGLLLGSGSAGPGFLLMFVLLLVLMVLSVVSILVRTHRASGVERQQIKWLALGAVPGLLVIPLGASGFPQLLPLQQFFFMWLPVTIGIAVLRYRLYDIDRLVNRTVVYATVSVLLAAVYGGSVLLLQIPLSQVARGDSLAVAASTLAAAALFQPVRGAVQRFVDHRFDRARYDGARAAAAFGARLRNEVDLEAVVGHLQEVVRTTIGPSSASVWLRAKPGKRAAGG
jgi:hypothetical protein